MLRFCYEPQKQRKLGAVTQLVGVLYSLTFNMDIVKNIEKNLNAVKSSLIIAGKKV